LARVDDLAGLEDLRGLVAGALRELNFEQREVVELRVVYELDYPQIARRLGISEQTARARLSRGLRALGAALDAAEGMA
jgi:RNA polymerase sigma-70 factor (ECF subfamily)